MKTPKKDSPFKLISFKSLFILFFTVLAAGSVSAQVLFASNNKPVTGSGGPSVPGSSVHTIPSPVISISTETSMVPLSTEELAAASGEINIAGNAVENHLLILEVRTQKRNLTTALYDLSGNRLTYENFIDAGSYRMIDHTRNLKPGIYYLYVMESGKVIEKEKFEIKQPTR